MAAKKASKTAKKASKPERTRRRAAKSTTETSYDHVGELRHGRKRGNLGHQLGKRPSLEQVATERQHAEVMHKDVTKAKMALTRAKAPGIDFIERTALIDQAFGVLDAIDARFTIQLDPTAQKAKGEQEP